MPTLTINVEYYPPPENSVYAFSMPKRSLYYDRMSGKRYVRYYKKTGLISYLDHIAEISEEEWDRILKKYYQSLQ